MAAAASARHTRPRERGAPQHSARRRRPAVEQDRHRQTRATAANCVRANTATPIPSSAARRYAGRAAIATWQREHGPEERRVATTSVSRNDESTIHGRHTVSTATRTRPAAGRHAAREQERRDARRAHHPGVQRVRVVQRAGHEPAREGRREQQRIELVEVRDQLAVDVRSGEADARR